MISRVGLMNMSAYCGSCRKAGTSSAGKGGGGPACVCVYVAVLCVCVLW